MKRLPILSKMLFFVCVSSMLIANVEPPPPPPPLLPYYYAAGSTINNYLIIPHVATAPALDGEVDAEWTFPDIGMFVYVDNIYPISGASDFSSLFRVAWNEDGFYFWGYVIDDSIYAAGPNSYQNDCWELYFDGDNSKGASYDANDIQWRYVYGFTADSAGWKDAGDCAWQTTDRGYEFELSIPVADLVKNEVQLFDLEEDVIIGFEVQLSDNDGAGGTDGGRECIGKWWSNSNDSWQQPVLFGTAILGGDPDDDAQVLEIVRVATSPELDGELDADWGYDVPEVAMTSVADRIFPDGGFDDFSSFFRAAWNEDGFYLFGRVVDDSIYAGGPNSYQQDCWEVYFDGDNSKGASYDANDIQWRYVYGFTNDSAGWKDNGDCAWLVTERGYNFELSIPVAELVKNSVPLFPLEEYHAIGFEVQCSDNDGVPLMPDGGREAILKWWSESNNSWQQPVLFGTAILTPGDGIPEPLAYNVDLSIPSVVGGSASISYVLPARSSVKLTIFNVAGQAVKTLVNEVEDAGTTTTTLDASGLANGVYFCTLEACGGAITQKVMLVK